MNKKPSKPLPWWEQDQEDLREAQGLNRRMVDPGESKCMCWFDALLVAAIALTIFAFLKFF